MYVGYPSCSLGGRAGKEPTKPPFYALKDLGTPPPRPNPNFLELMATYIVANDRVAQIQQREWNSSSVDRGIVPSGALASLRSGLCCGQSGETSSPFISKVGGCGWAKGARSPARIRVLSGRPPAGRGSDSRQSRRSPQARG